MKKSLHYLLITILFFVSCYGLYASYTRGSANAWYYKASFTLSDWANDDKIKDKQEYLETLEDIKKALELDPSHPHYNHILGRIIHWGIDMQYEDIEKLSEVKNWYLKSTELRPLWPDPWIDLAILNNYVNGYDDETKTYIQQALKTGPYINLVNDGVLQILLLNWAELTVDEKTLLFEQFAIATKQPELLTKILDFASQYEQVKPLCLQLKFNPNYSKQKDSSIYRRFCM